MSYAAPDIYTRIRGGHGYEGLNTSETFTRDQATLQASINDQVYELNGSMNQAWQGNAASQAVSGAAPLVNATDQANQSLLTASQTTNSQTSAFNTAYNSVVKMNPSAPQNNLMNKVVSIFGDTDLDKSIAQYQANGDHNVAVYNNYSSASSDNAAAMPTDYGTLPDASPNFSITSQSTSAGAGSNFSGSAGSSTGTSSGGYGGTGSGGGTTGSGFTRTPSTGGNSGSTGAGNPGGSDGGSSGNDSPEQLADFNPGDTTTTGNPSGGLDEFGPGGMGPGGVNGGGSDTSRDNPYAGAAGAFGGAGGGGLGSGGAGANGLGGAGSESANGSGSRAGVGNGMNPASEEAAMSRAAAGAAGEPGMAGGRGSGKKDEEDKEHKTAEYLQEADPDAIFGTDQLTVPPVIE
jgi:hypothetical protein